MIKVLEKKDWHTKDPNKILRACQNISRSLEKLDLALGEWEKYAKWSRKFQNILIDVYVQFKNFAQQNMGYN
jgi:hypothetical protein